MGSFTVSLVEAGKEERLGMNIALMPQSEDYMEEFPYPGFHLFSYSWLILFKIPLKVGKGFTNADIQHCISLDVSKHALEIVMYTPARYKRH